uniref:Putative X-prolyl aminopeptidase n=1 Tax=Schistosoma japonicum TaxID=6182 RepID=C1LFE5_SCHJA|nr:putative X-prolyl aminopeptidase [Schistosoma japonicum]
MKKILSLERLTRLRDLLKVKKLQGYILATEDEHFNEYVGVADRRCEFISGFTGSSCSIIVTLDKAALWTDGRYQLQGTNELDDNWSLFRNDLIESPTKAKWIVSSTPPGSSIGYDDANGAIIHYHPVEGQDAPITNKSIYLVDSGGQYLTGTTDVTRTIHLNEPTLEEKNCYTAVLKAHISLSMQIFPSNTPGSRLDVLSRRIMWQYRGNYAHGTGHGVGAFLNVHEGPIGLSGSRLNMYSRMGITEPGLQENMVVTIEPGYYWTDRFGIRLENVVFIVPVKTVDFDFNNMNTNNTLMTMHNSFQFASDNTDCTKWLTFEPVTLVPFQRKFININMLSMNELNWLNNYHNIIRKVLCQRIYQEVNINLSIDNENLDQQSILSNMSMLSSSRQRCLQWIINQTEILS